MVPLLLFLDFCALAIAVCNYRPFVEGITTYPVTLTSSGHNNQSYHLPLNSNLSSHHALALRSIQWQALSSWNLTLPTTNQTSIVILFSSNNYQWTSVSCILWTINNTFIFSSLGNLILPNIEPQTKSIVVQLRVGRPINYEDQSIAVVFVIGTMLRSGSTVKFDVVPFRVFNSSVFVNITGQNISELQSIGLSYIIFSPSRANFQSFGSIIQIPQSPNIQYFDISATVPNTEFIIFGIAGLQTKPSLRLEISHNNYLLSVSTYNTSASISYMYLAPQQISCNNCQQNIIYQNQCLSHCPDNTFMVNFGGVRFCRSCPKELHLQLQSGGNGCECTDGYVMEGQKCVRKFIPISLVVGMGEPKSGAVSGQMPLLAQRTELKQATSENISLELGFKQIESSLQNPIFLPPQVKVSRHSSLNVTSTKATIDGNLSLSVDNSSTEGRVNDQKVRSSQGQATSNTNDAQQLNKIDSSLFQDEIEDFNLTTTSKRAEVENKTAQSQNQNNNSSTNYSHLTPLQINNQSKSIAPNHQQTGFNTSMTLQGNHTTTKKPQQTPNTTRNNQNNTNNTSAPNNTIVQNHVERVKDSHLQNAPANKNSEIVPQVPLTLIITPTIVTKGIYNKSNSTVSIGCTSSPNSIFVSGKCVCKLGYINISNVCTPISQLLVASGTPKTVKATQACPSNQIYSIKLQTCTCPQGQKRLSNQSLCVSACSLQENYDLHKNACVCNEGLARINHLCVQCQQLRTGNQQCYPLQLSLVCRRGYIQSQGYCIRCTAVSIRIDNNTNCAICEGGFTYDGSKCICPEGYIEQNGTCLGSFCGNSLIQKEETCDDGNIINGDGCSSQCLIEPGFYCKNVSETCILAVCGDGAVNGGESCDDGNLINGDGCSSECLFEDNFTCLGVPSACFPGKIGNLSLTNLFINANNVFVQLRTGRAVNLESPVLASTFFKVRFLNGSQLATPYCQGGTFSDQFSCLLIYPQGVPVARNFILFSYSWQGITGSIIVEIGAAKWQWPLASRRQ